MCRASRTKFLTGQIISGVNWESSVQFLLLPVYEQHITPRGQRTALNLLQGHSTECRQGDETTAFGQLIFREEPPPVLKADKDTRRSMNTL